MFAVTGAAGNPHLNGSELLSWCAYLAEPGQVLELKQPPRLARSYIALGGGLDIPVVMCVVIGGVLLTGGTGSVVGIVIGTLTFAIVNQGIYFTGIDPNLGSVIIGALLLLAVMMNDKFRLMATSYAAKKKK